MHLKALIKTEKQVLETSGCIGRSHLQRVENSRHLGVKWSWFPILPTTVLRAVITAE